jgi:Peptidase family S41
MLNRENRRGGSLRRYLLPLLIFLVLTATIAAFIAYKRSGLAVSKDLPVLVTPANAEAWQQDLRYMAAEIPRRHDNAFHTISAGEFNRAVSDLDKAIPKLDNDQIVVRLMKIAALVGDGHTHVEIPANFHTFPLEVYWFGDTLRVTRVAPDYQRALGAKVVAIGDRPIQEVYASIETLVPQGESELWLRRLSPQFLVCAEILHGLSLLQSAEVGRYTFEDDARNRFTLDFGGVPESQQGTQQRWLSAAQTNPLYVQRPNEDVWFSYLESQHTLFFKFNQAPGFSDFYSFSKQLLKTMDHQPVERLVIDMRNNRGGDFTKLRWLLLPKLIDRRYRQQCFACPRELGRLSYLYVIIGRETYSAGVMNAVELRDQASAVLVGEPSGGRPNAYGEDRRFLLPNSRLAVFVSTRYYRLTQEDTPSLLPAKEIDLTWSDFVAGRDPVLEWVLREPKR